MNGKGNPIFSVIMPSYNHSRYIGDAIESVLNQSFGDLELIIVDDCSPDDSPSIIKSYKDGDGRIKAFFHENNQGISRTMNDAIGKACGKYIALFASDDLWLKDKLMIQNEILNNNEDVIVWSDGIVIDDQNHSTGKSFIEMHDAQEYEKNGWLLNELIRTNYIFGTSLAAKRENIAALHYDENLKYLNDYKIMVGLASRNRFFYVDKPLACYRVHTENAISSADDESWQKDRIMVYKYFISTYKDKITKRDRGYLYRATGIAYWRLGKVCPCLFYVMLALLFDWRDTRKSIVGHGIKS